MILRVLIVLIALASSFTSTIFGGSERGSRILSETGGVAGVQGIAGATGAAGTQGIGGIPGVPGTVLAFSDFYALMPGDNAATIAVNAPVLFPNTGSSNGVITSPTSSTFLLPAIGTYLVQFQVSVDQPGQLMLRLNGVPIANSVVGRDLITDQIVGMSLVTTTTLGSILEVINAPLNSTALTITPIAGGTHSVSAHLSIMQIQ